jgi:S1-C subfamily serine protease
MRIRLWAHHVLLILLLISASSQARAGFESGELAGVARVEIALDPFSFNPRLLEKLRRQTSPSSFEAELLRRLEYGSRGSAFCIHPGLLVTNAHVALAGARYSGLAILPHQWDSLEAEILAGTRPWISLDSPDGKRLRIPAEVVALDLEKDLALLHCHDPTGALRPLQLANPAELKVGLPVTAVGYDLQGLRVTRGEIESLIRGEKVLEPARVRSSPADGRPPVVVGADEGKIVRIQHSAPTEAGVSGGPLLNEKGEVVGVAYGLLRPTGENPAADSNLQLAISIGVVKEFLEGRTVRIPGSLTGRQWFSSNEQSPPQIITNGSIASRILAGSPMELVETERLIRSGNAAAAIPGLEARLRRSRQDFNARALLALAHYEESRFAHQDGSASDHLRAAFYQSAWLAYFAPEAGFGRQSREFIEDPGIQKRAAQRGFTSGIKTLLLSLEIQARLDDFLSSGRLSEDFRAGRVKLEEMLAECEKTYARSSKQDVVAAAALINAYLALEQAWAAWPALTEKTSVQQLRRRAALLEKALKLARPLAAELDRSPGAHSLLGLVYARIARLEGSEEALQYARRAYENASRLDPSSPSIKRALYCLQTEPVTPR